MVSDYLSNTLQRYKINSILPNISALFFKYFLKYFFSAQITYPYCNNKLLSVNKNRLLRDKKGTKGSDPFVPFYSLVVLTEITANGFRECRQLAFVIATFCHQIGH